jgi:hypothetical protein
MADQPSWGPICKRAYLELMLSFEKLIGDKLLTQKSFPEDHMTIFHFSTEKKGIFQIQNLDEVFLVTQVHDLPRPLSPPLSCRVCSAFYADYILFLAQQGFDAVSLQTIAIENLSWNLSTLLPFHVLTEKAVRKHLSRNSFRPLQFLQDQFQSLEYFMKILAEINTEAIESETSFLFMQETENGFQWGYAP